MRVGVSVRNDREAFASGQWIASEAVKKGHIERPDLAIAFCHGSLDHEAFFQGLKTVLGPRAAIVGGSAIGIISNDAISYQGHPAGAAILQCETLHHQIASVGELDRDETLAGRGLAAKFSGEPEGEVLLIFYDSIKYPAQGNSPPVLNASAPLLDGIEQGVQGKWPILGAGLMGDYDLGPTKQFCGTSVETQSLVGVLLSGTFKPYYKIMHGCAPLDGVYRKITRMEGSVVYELDHQPIVDTMDALYGSREWRNERPLSQLTLGINHGSRYGAPQEDQYVNRLIVGVLPSGEGIQLFEPDFLQGAEVQFMLRDISMIQESAEKNSTELMARIMAEGKRPLFGLYIDCAGRTSGQLNSSLEEAAKVQKVCNQNHVPLLGFYSGVEIAPLLNRSRGLDWTGVLLVLAEDCPNEP